MINIKDYLSNYNSSNKEYLKGCAISFVKEIKKISYLQNSSDLDYITIGHSKMYKHKDNVLIEINLNSNSELTKKVYNNIKDIKERIKLDVNIDIRLYSDFIYIFLYK